MLRGSVRTRLIFDWFRDPGASEKRLPVFGAASVDEFVKVDLELGACWAASEKRPTATELLVFGAQHARDGTKRAVFIAACAHGAELAAHFFESHALNQDVAGTGQRRQE